MDNKKYYGLFNEDEQCFGISDKMVDIILWGETLQRETMDELSLRVFTRDDIEDFDKIYEQYNLDTLKAMAEAGVVA